MDTPIQWDLLDAAGQVLVRERFGTELPAGELRQCNGCHAPHHGTTGNTTNQALMSPTNLSGQNVDQNDNGVVDLLEDTGGCSSWAERSSSWVERRSVSWSLKVG